LILKIGFYIDSKNRIFSSVLHISSTTNGALAGKDAGASTIVIPKFTLLTKTTHTHSSLGCHCCAGWKDTSQSHLYSAQPSIYPVGTKVMVQNEALFVEKISILNNIFNKHNK
jgi:hypothetical protein